MVVHIGCIISINDYMGRVSYTVARAGGAKKGDVIVFQCAKYAQFSNNCIINYIMSAGERSGFKENLAYSDLLHHVACCCWSIQLYRDFQTKKSSGFNEQPENLHFLLGRPHRREVQRLHFLFEHDFSKDKRNPSHRYGENERSWAVVLFWNDV